MAATSTRTFRPSAGQRRLGAKLLGAVLQPGLRAGVQLLPVPGAARRPGQEPHPQPPGPGRAGPGAARELRLGKPLHEQFATYVRDTLSGDLGISYKFRRPVSEVIGERIWPTVLLLGLDDAVDGDRVVDRHPGGVEAQQPVRPGSLGAAHPVRHARVLARHHAADRLRGRGRVLPWAVRPAGCPAPTPSWPARRVADVAGTCSCPASPSPWPTSPSTRWSCARRCWTSWARTT